MLLYVVRHGIAIDRDDPRCPPDPERYLTKSGVRKTRATAAGMAALGVVFDLVLSSPYVRAVQTAEAFCDALGVPRDRIRQSKALLPAAEPLLLFQELRDVREARLGCFGHAPNLDDVVAFAVGHHRPFTALKKAGVAIIELDQVLPPRGRLVALFEPQPLRRLAGGADE